MLLSLKRLDVKGMRRASRVAFIYSSETKSGDNYSFSQNACTCFNVPFDIVYVERSRRRSVSFKMHYAAAAKYMSSSLIMTLMASFTFFLVKDSLDSFSSSSSFIFQPLY